MHDRAEQHRRTRKTRDRSLALVLAGVALLMPPLAGIFEVEGKIFDLPVALVYLFAVWAGLIAGAWLLSRRLSEGDDSAGGGEP